MSTGGVPFPIKCQKEGVPPPESAEQNPLRRPESAELRQDIFLEQTENVFGEKPKIQPLSPATFDKFPSAWIKFYTIAITKQINSSKSNQLQTLKPVASMFDSTKASTQQATTTGATAIQPSKSFESTWNNRRH